MPYPRVPPTFARKKAKILRDLSVPDTEYSDRSPKGSVDEGIRELIDEINAFEGFVTTSSCAGRISVFQEGHGKANNGENGDDEVGRSGVPGGKGGGKFLFVSHEPVEVSENGGLQLLSGIFGGGEGSSADGGAATESLFSEQRFVRFAFEPMILHVMTASLHHAKPLLSAAVNSGFRESGVQSLKNLDDPNSCPMVAVRTAGLGLEAIIASVIEENEERPGHFQHLVANDYGIVLLRLANKRFEANQQRIEKFRVSLREVMASETTRVLQSETWESPEARRQRKRDQGLRDQAAAKAKLAKDIDFKTLVSSEDDRGHLRLHPND